MFCQNFIDADFQNIYLAPQIELGSLQELPDLQEAAGA